MLNYPIMQTVEPAGEFRDSPYPMAEPFSISRSTGSQVRLVGKAIAYGSTTTIYDFQETIAPRAARMALDRGDDIRALFNHDPNLILARRSNGSLDVWEVDTGLYVEITLTTTATTEHLVEAIRRGDVSGQSFSFGMDPADGARERWQVSDTDGIIGHRVIEVIGRLWDIGPVTFPAYPTTSLMIKSDG